MKPCGRVFNIGILKVSVYDMAASGFARTFGGGLSYSAIAPDIATCSWRPSTRKKLTRSCPRFSPHVRGPHFASKVSYSAFAPDFRHASVSLINSCFNSIKHPIRFHGNSKMLHPSSEGLYYDLIQIYFTRF